VRCSLADGDELMLELQYGARWSLQPTTVAFVPNAVTIDHCCRAPLPRKTYMQLACQDCKQERHLNELEYVVRPAPAQGPLFRTSLLVSIPRLRRSLSYHNTAYLMQPVAGA